VIAAKSISPNKSQNRSAPTRVEPAVSPDRANDWRERSNYSAKILVIDDDKPSVSALCRILRHAGYQNCVAKTDAAAALDQFLDLRPDLVLLDLHMEPVSGFDVLKRVNHLLPASSRPPILVLTADKTVEVKLEALWMGASDFLSKPLDHLEVLLRINHLLTSHNLFHRCQLHIGKLKRLVDKRTTELQRQTADLEKTLAQLRQAQSQIVQQERIKVLGTMAPGIAHDLNNGLSAILGYGGALLGDGKKFPPGTPERKCLEEILRAGSENAKLVARLRDFCRPCPPHEHKEPVKLNELVEQSIELTAPKWRVEATAAGATIHIEKKLEPISPVLGTPDQLREVLTSLIFNAVDAMPSGGWLRFYTRQTGNQIRLDIADTGIGMTDETVAKCLEPFFTTKGDCGSGLGLTSAYGIIRRHGGNLDIASEVGQGTRLTISFPAFDQERESHSCPVRNPDDAITPHFARGRSPDDSGDSRLLPD
jgi:signal transduction histidine kinase